MARRVSWRDRIIAYMVSHNYTEVESPSRKYKAFKPGGIVLRDNVFRRYFVGASGAVRVSNKGTVSDARSVTETFQKMVTHWEQSLALEALTQSQREMML